MRFYQIKSQPYFPTYRQAALQGFGLQGLYGRIRLGNTEVDGEAIGPNGERIAIEIKTPRDDLARGIGQLAEALAFGYDKAVLVTTLKNTRTISDSVFKRFGVRLDGSGFSRRYR